MLKIVEVSQVDYEKGLVKVKIPDRDNVESNWMAMSSFEYEMPRVNDYVRVDMDDDDYKNGICHGRYYNEGNLPILHGPNIYYKRLLGDLVVQYDSDTKTLELTADHICVRGKTLEVEMDSIKLTGAVEVVGDVSIQGDLTVDGSISASGSVTDAGGNTNHHVH